MTDQSVGRRIRLRRQALKLTQAELARLIGVERATVSAWERDKQWPQRHEGRLEDVLGISLTDDETAAEPPWETADERTLWELGARLDVAEDVRLGWIAGVRAAGRQRRLAS